MLRVGTFKATPQEWAVNNSSKGLPQFVCRFALDEEVNGEDWVDVSGEGLEITAYLNLIYVKDGAPVLNKINVESIEKSFGWTGRQMDVLDQSDWSQVQVQLVLEEEEYNGQARVKVKYLNPADYVGGNSVKKADPTALAQMQQQFAAVLGAGAPAAGAPAAKARTVSNPNKSAPKPPANALELAKREAWEKFQAKHPKLKGDAMAGEWRKAIQSVFNQPATQLGAAQWRKFVEQDFAPIENPIGDSPEFKEEDIPF